MVRTDVSIVTTISHVRNECSARCKCDVTAHNRCAHPFLLCSLQQSTAVVAIHILADTSVLGLDTASIGCG